MYSIIKQGAIETTKDPQEIVADGFLEMGGPAYTVSRDNMKRAIRKIRQVERNEPANPSKREKR